MMEPLTTIDTTDLMFAASISATIAVALVALSMAWAPNNIAPEGWLRGYIDLIEATHAAR
jgi:hypothetical protein